jgi:hypothetical protein
MSNFFEFSRQDAKAQSPDKKSFLGGLAALREVKNVKEYSSYLLK